MCGAVLLQGKRVLGWGPHPPMSWWRSPIPCRVGDVLDTLSVLPGQAEPAGPHPPPRADPHWGEWGWSEMLLRQGMAGF